MFWFQVPSLWIPCNFGRKRQSIFVSERRVWQGLCVFVQFLDTGTAVGSWCEYRVLYCDRKHVVTVKGSGRNTSASDAVRSKRKTRRNCGFSSEFSWVLQHLNMFFSIFYSVMCIWTIFVFFAARRRWRWQRCATAIVARLPSPRSTAATRWRVAVVPRCATSAGSQTCAKCFWNSALFRGINHSAFWSFRLNTRTSAHTRAIPDTCATSARLARCGPTLRYM